MPFKSQNVAKAPKRKPGRPSKADSFRRSLVDKYGDLAVDRMERCFETDGVDMASLTDEQFDKALAVEESQRGRMRK